MKPKHQLFRRIPFPCIIIVASMPLLSAAPINPDPAGNITVPAGPSRADTIVASGGTSPAPVVTVQSGATLTGDAVLLNAAIVSAPGYTINNAGTLSSMVEGIFVETAASGSTTINNNGIIEGGSDGIYFNGDGGFITNMGTIRGITGVDSDGIEGFSNITVMNSGLITGAAGIFAEDNLRVTNNAGSTISGTTDAAINAVNSAFVDNLGTIRSTAIDAIIINNDGEIFNGGLIEGATNGIFTGTGLSLLNEAGGRIIGLNGIGVDAGAGAEIFNDPGAVISGTLGGVSVGALGYVENDGTISGNGGDGVTLGMGGEILNSGIIEGTTGIVANNGSTITSSGIIRSTAIGGNAFSGGAGADNLFFNAGSLVSGNVLGGGGGNTITFVGGLSSPTSPGNLIRGSVTGFSTITKNGVGVALIGGVADVGNGLVISADTIAITGGGLYFNADIGGSTVPQATINAGGAAIGGTGVWNANVNITAGGATPGGISAGAIPINLDANPENAVGSVAITGDVVHTAGSFIRLDIVSGAPVIDGINSDIIEQIGAGNTYDVTGANLRISSTNGNKAISDGTYTLVDSDEAIIGAGTIGTIGIQFNANTAATGPFLPTESGSNATNTVLTNFFLTTGLEDGGTNLVINIDRNYAGLPGLTQNQSALGGALDSAVGSSDPLVQSFIAALDFSNLAAVQAALAALNPEVFIDFSAGIVNTNYRLHRTLQDHLAGTRSAEDVVRMQVGAQMDSKGGMTATPDAVSSPPKFTVWGSTSYDWQDYEGSTSANDFDGETAAITAGFDYRVSPDLLLALVLDGSNSEFDSDAFRSDIDSFRAIVYGTWGRSTGLYSDFMVGYGDHDLDLDRRMGGILGGSSSSTTDATSWQALWTIGYTFGDTRIKHGPYAGLEYQNVEIDGYDQSGGLPVAVEGYDDESFRALLGYRVNTKLGRLTPYASIAYAHEFEDDGVSTTASVGGASFRIRGAERGSAVILTAGTGISVTDMLQFDVGYRGEVSVEDEGIDSHGATVGLKYRF
ncbi:MAG: autotransporter outer membrane beta-barrel domain-containing protein [Verrucomicrobiaceae bacterium]|nr:MAG: autotransporter outer membrane beta-barrel domain-containing protein [Verrucomicrobiaceae bacterium]